MKKIFTNLAVCGLAMLGLTANALDKTYVVYPEADAENEVLITTEYYQWEGTYTHEDVEDATVPGGKYMKWTNQNMVWFGGGYLSKGFDMTPIATGDYDLVFQLKTTYTGELKYQFNNTTQTKMIEQPFSFTGDGEWHEVRINLKEKYADVLNSITAESEVYCFTLIGYATEATDFCIADVRFEPAAETPGGGDDPVTPPTTGTGAVWNGTADSKYTYEGTEYPFTISYAITYNEDKTITVNADLGAITQVVGFVPEFNIPENDPEYSALTLVEGTNYTVSSTRTFEEGEQVTMFFWLKYAGGVQRVDVEYTVGASNEPVVDTPMPVVTGYADEISTGSAMLYYSVSLPEELAGATVAVTIDGVAVEYIAGEENTYAKTGLTANTSYETVIVATATLDGVEYTSEETKVSFKTLSNFVGNGNTFNGSAESTYKGELDGVAFEDDVTINYSVTWNEDATLTFVVTPSVARVGLVPQINYGTGFKNLVATGNENEYSYTTTETYEENTSVNCEILLACAGGAASTSFTYVVGSASEPVSPDVITVAITEPKVVSLTSTAAEVSFDVTVSEAAIGKTVIIKEGGVEKENFVAETLTTTVSYTYSDLAPSTLCTYSYTAEVENVVSESREVNFTTLGSDPVAFTVNEYTEIAGGDWVPEFEATVSTSPENHLIFTVTLPDVPEGFVGTVLVNDVAAGQLSVANVAALATETVYTLETANEYDGYVTFYFNFAYAGGGLAKTKVFGYTVGGDTVSGIRGVEAVANGEVVYYNFQGVRVANPENGVYIRVQNGKATKVIVK